MKKPKSIPLSDNPRCKEVSKIPLTQSNQFDIQMQDDTYPNPNDYKTFWRTQTLEKNDEDNQQNNSEGIQ
jgi:hypothetical protein